MAFSQNSLSLNGFGLDGAVQSVHSESPVELCPAQPESPCGAGPVAAALRNRGEKDLARVLVHELVKIPQFGRRRHRFFREIRR